MNYFVLFFFIFLVSFRDIKEIRKGKGSKDFDKWPDDARRVDQRLCFVVYYGNDFKLRTLSVVSKYPLMRQEKNASENVVC